MSEFFREFRERRVLAAAALGLTGALALSACGESLPEVTEGTITEKEFTPAHTETIYVPYCVGSKPRICSLMPVPVHHDDNYEITLQNCTITPPEMDECLTREVEVPKDVYETLYVGQSYKLPAEATS